MRAKLTFQPEAGLDRLLLRNAVLEMATLRLYRFWARTDLRRHLWASLKVGDDALEYTGQGYELFAGFAVAVAVFIPPAALVSGFFVVNADTVLATLVANGWWLAAVFLGAAGSYSARGYRLSRTLWRGIYAGQDGSSWAYAGRYVIWCAVFCVTAGLSVPWACEDLARYRIHHTIWGNRRAQFHGRANQLMRPWLTVWVLCVGPLYGLCLWQIWQADGNATALFWGISELFDLINRRGDSMNLYGVGVALLWACLAWLYFYAHWLEWLLDQLDIGPLQFACRLSAGLSRRLLQRSVLPALYGLGALTLLMHANLHENGPLYQLDYIESVWACLTAAYIASVGLGAIWFRFVKLPLLQEIAAGTSIDNAEATATTTQSRLSRPRFGEGLWDVSHAHLF
jgi:uncharacterized membrane protein YjgN (DUF898 family)